MNKEIQLLFRENINDKLQEIRDKGGIIYSISKINNYNTCPRQYYYTYIDKKPQRAGIYGILGTSCHSDLEELYEGNDTQIKPNNFNNEWVKADLFGIKFPSDKIKENYKKDIDGFYNNYKKREGEFISELGFILQIDDKHYLTGFIDLIQLLDNNKVKIIDFKTSAMFKDEKLLSAGRQLIVYQLALEQLYGLETVENGWEMLKYLKVTIGNNKAKIVSAREWVSKCESQLRTLLKKNTNIEPIMIDMYLAQCIKNNSIETLPRNIQDMVTKEIYFMPYQITEELKQETIDYIRNSINVIESIDDKDINMWQPSINDFFCKNLCSFGGGVCECCK